MKTAKIVTRKFGRIRYLSPHALPTDQHLGNSVESFSSDHDHALLHGQAQVCVCGVHHHIIIVGKQTLQFLPFYIALYSLSCHLCVCGDGLNLLLHYTMCLFCPMKFGVITVAQKICSYSSPSVGGVCWWLYTGHGCSNHCTYTHALLWLRLGMRL